MLAASTFFSVHAVGQGKNGWALFARPHMVVLAVPRCPSRRAE